MECFFFGRDGFIDFGWMDGWMECFFGRDGFIDFGWMECFFGGMDS